MLLKKIKIKNIRSYKEGVVEFPEGSTLLSGDIGSGKTSVLLAIEFALFGLQPGQKANSIMRNNEEEASVVLEFEVDEQRIVIERGLKKSGKSIGQSDIAISVNNERFEGSVTEIKNKILSLLNYPPEFAKKTNDLYKFTVYTPQEEMKQIVQESNDVRLNTLRHVFGIDKYKKIEENLDILTAKIRQEIRIKEVEMGNVEQKNTQVKDKKDTLIIQQSRIKDIDKEIYQIELLKIEKQKEIEELQKKIEEKNKLQNELAKSEMALSSKKEIINTYEREIRNISEQIKILSSISFNEREVTMLKGRLKSQEQTLKDLNDQYLSLATIIQSNDSKVRELKILRDKISALDKCPTCLQLVASEYKQNIVSKAQSELILIEREMVESKKTRENVYKNIEQTRNQIDLMRHSISEMEILKIKLENLREKEQRMQDIEKQKVTAFNDIAMIKSYVEGINAKIKEFRIFEASYEQKNKEMREIIVKDNATRIRKAEFNKEIQFLEKQILDLEQEIKRMEETAKKLKYMKELEFWLNNKFIELVLYTEKNVMLKLREDFSQLFSNWFSLLVPETISVRLDESFSPVIQQTDYELDYAYLSGGERTAVALAYRLALNQTINSVLSKIKTRDLVILDEPTDGFSESQLDRIRDILIQLKVRQLILVSHEQKIEGFVDNIIRFKKTNGVTEIEKDINS